MEEIWKDIVGYEGLYAVSNWGRVKSLYDGSHKIFREKILSPGKDGGGYLQIMLYKCGKPKRHYVHRLVLMTFSPVENMDELQVNHINECKTDNRLQNLEWCTALYNTNFGTHNARVAEKKSIPIAQLNLEGKLVKVWESSMEAKRGGYNQGAINSCCKNKYIREGNNIYKGYKWCYLYTYISNIDTRIKKIILFDKEYMVN